MVINEIFQSVNASIANDKLVICDKTFALPSPGIEGFLSKRFGRNALEISHVKLKKLNEESFEVTGTTDVEVESTFLLLVKQSEKDIMFTFSLTIPKSIICIYEKNYNTTETKKQYIFFMNNPLEDLISMGGNLTEPLSLASILGIALGSKDNPSADFPALSLQNIHLTYGTELSYSKLRECIYFSTETNFNISTNICLQSLGFEIKKRDKLFDLAMHATIKLVGQVLPIVLRYSDSRFLFGLRIPKEGLIFSSIEEIAKLSNSNVSAYLPSAFTQIEVTLYKLSIIFPTNLSKIISFDFSASLGLDWKFFGLEKLRLKEIAVMVSIAEKNSFAISGTLQIGSLSLRLLAQTEDVNKSLVFGGSFIKDSKLYLDDIVNSLADLIGVSNISFPDSFPEIYIENLSFLFDVKQSNIKFSATLVIEKKEDGSIIDKLFQMKANVNVEAKKSGKSYEYTGKFGGYLTIMEQHFTVEYVFGKNSGDIITAKWECTEKDNNPLSLSGLAEFFGVSKLPQELDDLGIACNLIELQYNISKNVLDCTVKSNEYGSIHFIITTDEEKKTQFGLNVNMIKTISLSKLPVVGEGLKLLDQVAIKDINIKFGSKQMSDKGIESGLKLKAALCIVDKQYEFAIDIIKPKEKEVQQFTLYEEGDTEVISADNAKEEITDISGVAKWFKIEKNLGVFSLHRLGVVWENGHLGVALDADLAVNPIKIELIGLGLGFKLSDLSDFSSINYYLSGLGISYNSPSLEIGGTFVVCKGNAENPEDSYDGVVNIKTKVLSITAIGSYQNDSIFAFAILKAQIGGPPAFFVTGLALGFGYNR
ncbi:DUF6603 domain-containing protein, partial [Anaerosporobacter sp.]|uniref:DUF6603 domain-containing protein n=1 Tax=Anaerosporobacter sp. TaxID=1872529 RepID=UPI00286FAD2D